MSSLIQSVKLGDLENVKRLVENGSDIHEKGDIAIVIASSYGDLEMVKFLISKGINSQAYSDSAFIYACTRGYLEVAEYIYSNSWVDVHADDDAAFRHASSFGHVEVIKFLACKGANIKNPYGLRWAVINKHIEVVKFLISKGVKANERDFFNACELGAVEILKEIITSSADIDLLLEFACTLDKYEIIKFLVEEKGGNRNLLSLPQKLYLTFCREMKKKNMTRAANKIYFWWIPKCYRLLNENGEFRMAVRAWNKLKD